MSTQNGNEAAARKEAAHKENTQKKALEQLVGLSREFGQDSEYVLLGGGNTSWKDDAFLFVKASGHALGSIDRSGFVKMRRDALDAVWETSHAEDKDEREQQVLQELMEARAEGEAARPSVEALLHSLIPDPFIVHLHPARINGITCGRTGKETVRKLFGNRALWIPLVNPGYILAKTVKEYLEEHQAQTGTMPPFIFLQNHGIFVSAETPEQIRKLYAEVMNTITAQLSRTPDMEPVPVSAEAAQMMEQGMRKSGSALVQTWQCAGGAVKELLRFAENEQSAEPVMSSYTPDHIVYSGHKPLWVPDSVLSLSAEEGAERIAGLIDSYTAAETVPPKVVLVQRTGAFGLGAGRQQAESALQLFYDTVKVAVYSESFGGHLFMTQDQIDFIRNWEAESYRSNMAEKE